MKQPGSIFTEGTSAIGLRLIVVVVIAIIVAWPLIDF